MVCSSALTRRASDLRLINKVPTLHCLAMKQYACRLQYISFIRNVIFLIFALTFKFLYIRRTFIFAIVFENIECSLNQNKRIFACDSVKKQNKNRIKFSYMGLDSCFKMMKIYFVSILAAWLRQKGVKMV